jgi:dihydroflavonol-4-reductase
MSKNAFVTGATGLLGTNLVRELVREGWKVKALARSRPKFERLFRGIEVEPVTGDMEDLAGFATALRGCDTLFHCAAYFREYYSAGEHEEILNRINVRGTIELLNAAERADVSKVIYVSSSGVLGMSASSGTIDESAPYANETSNLYFRSKIHAEQRLFDWLTSHRMPVVLILPGWML